MHEPSSGLNTSPFIVLLRLCAVLLILVVLGQTIVPFGASLLAQIFPSTVVELTNRDRTFHNLSKLHIDPLLMRAARMKAEDMANQEYFSHESPKGIDPWYWFDAVGYPYSYAGENLALNFDDSTQVFEAWAESEEHYAIIINRDFSDVGVGVATGTYHGRPAIFITQLFGTRAE